jgi:hypothetical protein
LGRNLLHRSIDVTQIGVAVAAPRRGTDGNKYCFCAFEPLCLNREAQPSLSDISFEEVGQSRLEDRDLPTVECRHSLSIFVDAGYVVPEISKTGPGYQAHVTGAYHRNTHVRVRFNSEAADVNEKTRNANAASSCFDQSLKGLGENPLDQWDRYLLF